jgi:LPS-assembly protein
MIHYNPAGTPNKIFNFGYRYRNDHVDYNQMTGKWQFGPDYVSAGQTSLVKDEYKIQQHDLSIMWPITPQWELIARWQYDYAQKRTLEAFCGLEYENCCWKLGVINRYWVSNDEYSQTDSMKGDNGIFFQVVLKGLSRLTSSKIESFLDKGIQGYREREYQDF